MSQFFDREPSREFAGAKRAWMAGQTRPAGALPIGQAAGGALIVSGAVALVFALSQAHGSARLASSLALMLWPVMKTLATPLGTIAGREASARQASLAWRVIALKARAELSDMGGIPESFGSVGAAMFGPRAKSDSSQDGFLREESHWTGRLERFGADMIQKGGALRRRSERLSRRDLKGLSEIGAWRLAFDLARESKYAEAAQVWLARPFNPDWTGRLTREGDGLKGSVLGRWENFETALERGAQSSADPSESEFCSKTLAMLRSIRERGQIEGALDEKANEALVARPRKPSASL